MHEGKCDKTDPTIRSGHWQVLGMKCSNSPLGLLATIRNLRRQRSGVHFGYTQTFLYVRIFGINDLMTSEFIN